MIRWISFVAGGGLLAAATHATIAAAGGYHVGHVPLLIALAIGTAVGALVLGKAWGQGRRGIALLIALALACGEAWALLSTGERIVTARDAAAAPLRDAAARNAAAVAAWHAAKAETMPAADRSRLVAAEARQQQAGAAVRASAADRGCRAECAKLLQAAVDAAGIEVAAARAELAERERRQSDELAAKIRAAEAAVIASPIPASATPLADRLGVAPWVLDLALAALGSIAANGLAIGLIAYAGHGHARSGAKPASEIKGAPIEVVPMLEVRPVAEVVDFLAQRVGAGRGRKGVDAIEVYRAYAAWAAQHGLEPLPPEEFGSQFVGFVEARGLQLAETADSVRVHGIRLLPAPMAR